MTRTGYAMICSVSAQVTIGDIWGQNATVTARQCGGRSFAGCEYYATRQGRCLREIAQPEEYVMRPRQHTAILRPSRSFTRSSSYSAELTAMKRQRCDPVRIGTSEPHGRHTAPWDGTTSRLSSNDVMEHSHSDPPGAGVCWKGAAGNKITWSGRSPSIPRSWLSAPLMCAETGHTVTATCSFSDKTHACAFAAPTPSAKIRFPEETCVALQNIMTGARMGMVTMAVDDRLRNKGRPVVLFFCSPVHSSQL